ncbi:hypothetical protein MPTK1_8g04090 [Marchantia polymorpha subsp. ruderalis]|uniref:Carotenoid cleavage dioxygenase n=1 Tax=Marchantia polymorpha TaxID=3197 RepID=A0A2R6XJH0_MARPO|nr:hypothetical protein MARPO_0012s0198 [Marchantia polymorpha]BBN18630.1 hypothetical protein Mp_8g04090 [Marchantia polymorpha subsp. ruderalis]|eukprot:PTQ46277.1 hypothetical protein MARPO_0012s0198 [Marchantia polymorpha]
MASVASTTFRCLGNTHGTSQCGYHHAVRYAAVVPQPSERRIIRQKSKSSKKQIQKIQPQNKIHPSETSLFDVEQWEINDVATTDGRRNVPGTHYSEYSAGLDRNSVRVLVQLKKWFQEQKETVEVAGKQLLSAYQLAMTSIVDQLFVPSDEPVPFIKGNFAPVDEIVEKVRCHVLEGHIPEDFPPGCFIRNGPNPRFGAYQNLDSPLLGGKTYYNWFEGEGMLHATYIEKDGSIWYKNKYVETDSFKMEKELGKRVYLPTMDEKSTPGLRFNRIINLIRYGAPQRNPGNTSVFQHAGHVVAAAEGAKAYEINISDLSTKGEYNCDGQWNRRFFGPHPKVHPDTGELVVFGFDIIPPYYVLGVLSGDGKKFANKVDLGMDRLVLMHDIGITERHAILYDFPVMMDLANMLVNGGSIVSFDPTKYSRLGVLPLTGNSKSIKWFDVETACISHHCNSYQDGDEIVVHGLCTQLIQLVAVPAKFDKVEWYSRGMTLDTENYFETKDPSVDGLLYEHLHEWRLNLRTGAVVERNITQNKFPLELPKINDRFNGKKYNYIYACSEDLEASKAVGYPMFKKLVKIDVSPAGNHMAIFHDVGENSFCSEPVFVARPGSLQEDDGWIVTYVHNESTNVSDMIIVDAQRFEEKPVARIRLPHRVPYGFHGAYISQ